MRLRVVSQIRPRSGYILETLKVGLSGRQNPDAFTVLHPAEEGILRAIIVLDWGSVLLGMVVDEI